jgi:DNA-binding XRE family transcriptional regulator
VETIQISLAAARVNAGMTQEDVAQKMHVSKQTVLNWEKGKVAPRTAQLEMLSRIYEFPVDNIFLPKTSTLS